MAPRLPTGLSGSSRKTRIRAAILALLILSGVWVFAIFRQPPDVRPIPEGMPPAAWPPENWGWGRIKLGTLTSIRYGLVSPDRAPRASVLIFTSGYAPAESWFEPARLLIEQGYSVGIFELKYNPVFSRRQRIESLAEAIVDLRMAMPSTPQILVFERQFSETATGLKDLGIQTDALVEVDALPQALRYRTARWFGEWAILLPRLDLLEAFRPRDPADLDLGSPESVVEMVRKLNGLIQDRRSSLQSEGP